MASFADFDRRIDALDVKLTEEEVRYLEEPYQAAPLFGHQ